MCMGGYNQATSVKCYYQIQYDQSGNLVTGLIVDPMGSGAYMFRLGNGRVLTHVTVELGGVRYTFDHNGYCYAPVRVN